MSAEQENSHVQGPTSDSYWSCLGCGVSVLIGVIAAAGSLRLGGYLHLDQGLTSGWAFLIALATFVFSMVITLGTLTALVPQDAPPRLIGVTGLISGVEEHGQEPRSGARGSVIAFKNGTIRIELEHSTLEEALINSRLSASVSVFEPETLDDEMYYCLYLSDASSETSEMNRWFTHGGRSYPCIAVKLSVTDGEQAAKIINDFNAASTIRRPQRREPDARFVNTAREAEVLAAEWIEWMGWDDVSVTVTTGDSGIDIVGKSSVLGKIVAQVKLEGRPTGRPALQGLRGAAAGESATHWMFFSAAGYTRAAAEWGDQVDRALFQFSRDGRIEPMNEQAQRYFEGARLCDPP
ncbi:restriction endonuclease [Nesterenkonia sp. YGD6]|uniref:restriction endonuclease n=1 Tax=Nesterenkonia sp. YGD6 TaxID=2901231 RepID=UPI001F4CBC47|nr:restriction endonuclease [Nesterenkonia sp. YGD6]MCH8562034.1 restriction endonuclease [Nesterenkonia sp. YGD6]